jgi:hypothetical protein
MRKILGIVFALSFCFSFSQNCSTVPAQNKKIIAYVKSKIGKSDDDFIEHAFKFAGIKFHEHDMGEIVEYQLDCVYPGDIISLGSCETKWKRNDTTFGMSYTCDRYFIIYKVKDWQKGIFQIAALDYNLKEEKVLTIQDFSLSYIKKGRTAIIYRPRKK